MSDLKKYNPPPRSADLYMAASKHFQQAKLILENVTSPDAEVQTLLLLQRETFQSYGMDGYETYLIIINVENSCAA